MHAKAQSPHFLEKGKAPKTPYACDSQVQGRGFSNGSGREIAGIGDACMEGY